MQYFWPALSDAIIRFENQFLVFLRVAVLDRFYCTPMHNKSNDNETTTTDLPP